MATALQTPATDKQVSFLRKLAGERIAPFLGDSALKRGMTVNEMVIAGLTKNEASGLISNLLRKPIDAIPTPTLGIQRGGLGSPQSQPKEVAAKLTPGAYDVDGHVDVVKPNQQHTRLYAMRLVEIASDRMNAEGDMVQIEFVYEAGAIFNVKPEHRMSFDDAKMLTIRYGRCIVCGRRLKAGKSVEQGIGPVCRKLFT
jgi:hypothetical protein